MKHGRKEGVRCYKEENELSESKCRYCECCFCVLNLGYFLNSRFF